MALGCSSSSVSYFVEIVRSDADGSLTLNFRRRGATVDGQAFYCLVKERLKHCKLFRDVSTSTSKLKMLAVQSDAFTHTGNVQCGFCVVRHSQGHAKLTRVSPNTPYVVALAVVVNLSGADVSEGEVSQSDPTPFLDSVELKELHEKSNSRIHAAFRIVGQSFWRSNLIPSLLYASQRR